MKYQAMKPSDDIATAIRELAAAMLVGAQAIREAAARLSGFERAQSDETKGPSQTVIHWRDTDAAFAQRAVRSMNDSTVAEQRILERMRQRMPKTAPPNETEK